jgi:hypothetical protein
VQFYLTAGQRIIIRGHHSLYPSLSAMKNLGSLSQMYADEKPSQIDADDYPWTGGLHCDTTSLLSTPCRHAAGKPARNVHGFGRLERSIVQTVKK